MNTRFERGGAAAHAAVTPPARASRLQARRSERLGLGRGILAALALLAAAAACDLLDDDQEYPSVARVEITGTAPKPLELVVSDDFQRVANVDQGERYTVLVRADTSQVELDFVKEYDIELARRFFVRLTNHSAEVASIVLSVAFDGEIGYTQRANISEGGALEFSEIFFGT